MPWAFRLYFRITKTVKQVRTACHTEVDTPLVRKATSISSRSRVCIRLSKINVFNNNCVAV